MTDVKQLLTQHLDIWLTAETEKKSGRGRSSGSSDTIYGVKKLRDLILDLAIQGKITEQFPKSESAEDLYKKILTTKKELLESENQKIKLLSNPDSSEIKFTIPENWLWIRLGNIGVTSTGKTPKTSNEASFNGNIPFIGPGQITNDNRILVAEKFLTDIGVHESTVAVKGDILTVCIGGSIGKSALVTDKLTFNQQLNCIHPLILESKYLYHVLTSNYFIRSILNYSSGSATPIINKGKWENILVPIAPLEEQQRIVTKVDELMQLCDQLEEQQNLSNDAHVTLVDTLLKALTKSNDVEEFQANWQRIVANFDLLFTTDYSIEQLKQSILQLAVMGKLVKQDPNDEPASELLKHCKQAKQQMLNKKLIRKSKNEKDIQKEDILFFIPDNWEWARMHHISYKVTDGAHHTPKYMEKGVPFLSVKDMSSGYLNFSDTKFISEVEHNELFQRCNPEKGDLLITKVGTTGIPIVVNTDKALSLFVSVALVKGFWEYINVDFLGLQVASPFVKKQSKDGTEGIGNKNLVLKKIENFLLVVPPLNEQKRIVEKVNQLFSMIEQLQTLQSKLQKTKLQLADALVVNAVEGE